jgi:hypothetical protein
VIVCVNVDVDFQQVLAVSHTQRLPEDPSMYICPSDGELGKFNAI